MYKEIIGDYEKKMIILKEERDLNRERIKAANLKLSNQILSKYNENAKELKENQIDLGYKIDNLIEKSKKIDQKAKNYIGLYNEVNSHFKVVGDLVNFLEKIEDKLVRIVENEIKNKNNNKKEVKNNNGNDVSNENGNDIDFFNDKDDNGKDDNGKDDKNDNDNKDGNGIDFLNDNKNEVENKDDVDFLNSKNKNQIENKDEIKNQIEIKDEIDNKDKNKNDVDFLDNKNEVENQNKKKIDLEDVTMGKKNENVDFL